MVMTAIRIQQYYLMARYYEPAQGVFTAIDPDPGDDDDPQTMNGYNYAGNNPVMRIDPDGHFWHYVAAAGGGVAFGVAKYYWKNRGKKKSWRGAVKAGAKGALSGLSWVGPGRIIGFGSKMKAGFRVARNRHIIKNVRRNGGQYYRNIRRVIKNPRKQLRRSPIRRLEGMRKARKNSLRYKLIRASNAWR